VDTASRHLTDYSSHFDEDPAELDQIETRLALLSELKRKYRMDEKGLIAKREELAIQMSELENFDEIIREKQNALAEATRKLEELAKSLNAKRKAAGKKLSTQLEKVLKDLALPHAKIFFLLEFLPSVTQYSSTGGDKLSLMISFNPGEETRPFEEVISGGELSRLLLAMYEILFPPDQFETLIFDEVDAGVGGKVAELIGRKLEALSKKSQVLCVTHLPQIACHAAWQYSVEKAVREGRTFSQIRLLKKEDREQEIARMLAGVKITEQALKHARELLKNAAA
jgi:DNA repair protein RecN (Recombination protein N)